MNSLSRRPGTRIHDPRFQLAVEVMDRADRMSLDALRSRSYRSWTKENGSPAIDVETAIERMIATAVNDRFSTDAILGEELCRTGEHRNRWIIDPLDGTASFIEGIPIYAHMICYQDSESTLFSLVSAPGLRARWWAYRGVGAFRDDHRTQVSRVSSLSAARIAYGGLRDYGPELPAFVRLASECMRSRGFGNFLPHVLVAEGTYDLASSAAGCSEWDVAPLALLIEEAGGRMSAFDGRPWTGSQSILTSNGLLHETAVEHLRSATPADVQPLPVRH